MGETPVQPIPQQSVDRIAERARAAKPNAISKWFALVVASQTFNLILGFLTIAAVLFSTLLVLRYFAVTPQLSLAGKYAIAGASAALIGKMLLSAWFGMGFKHEKQGYDMCVMAFGTSVTTLGYELSISVDHPTGWTMTYVVAMTAVAVFATIRAGLNLMKIEANSGNILGLKWANFGLGAFAIALNILLLVAKDVKVENWNTNTQHAYLSIERGPK
jgi:hypothetical protein